MRLSDVSSWKGNIVFSESGLPRNQSPRLPTSSAFSFCLLIIPVILAFQCNPLHYLKIFTSIKSKISNLQSKDFYPTTIHITSCLFLLFICRHWKQQSSLNRLHNMQHHWEKWTLSTGLYTPVDSVLEACMTLWVHMHRAHLHSLVLPHTHTHTTLGSPWQPYLSANHKWPASECLWY